MTGRDELREFTAAARNAIDAGVTDYDLRQAFAAVMRETRAAREAQPADSDGGAW